MVIYSDLNFVLKIGNKSTKIKIGIPGVKKVP